MSGNMEAQKLIIETPRIAKIIQSKEDGLFIEGKKVHGFISDSLKIRRIGDKTVVSVDIICETFESIPH